MKHGGRQTGKEKERDRGTPEIRDRHRARKRPERDEERPERHKDRDTHKDQQRQEREQRDTQRNRETQRQIQRKAKRHTRRNTHTHKATVVLVSGVGPGSSEVRLRLHPQLPSTSPCAPELSGVDFCFL